MDKMREKEESTVHIHRMHGSGTIVHSTVHHNHLIPHTSYSLGKCDFFCLSLLLCHDYVGGLEDSMKEFPLQERCIELFGRVPMKAKN